MLILVWWGQIDEFIDICHTSNVLSVLLIINVSVDFLLIIANTAYIIWDGIESSVIFSLLYESHGTLIKLANCSSKLRYIADSQDHITILYMYVYWNTNLYPTQNH